jgi:hypothetical protein
VIPIVEDIPDISPIPMAIRQVHEALSYLFKGTSSPALRRFISFFSISIKPHKEYHEHTSEIQLPYSTLLIADFHLLLMLSRNCHQRIVKLIISRLCEWLVRQKGI